MGNFGILSIAEASPNKEAAWAFIKHWASAAGSWTVCRTGQSAGRARPTSPKELFGDNPAMGKVQTEFVPKVRGIQPHPKILEMLQSIWPVAEKPIAASSTARRPSKR